MKEQTDQSRPQLYLLVGLVLLLGVGLFWSLDSSIVYFFAGAATFFLFLYFLNSPAYRASPRRETQSRRYTTFRPEKRPVSDPVNVVSGERPTAVPRIVRVVVNMMVVSFIGVVGFFLSDAIFGDDYPEEMMYYEQAERYRWSGEFDSANQFYRAALMLDPDYADARVGYGNSLTGLMKYDSAVLQFDAALDADPENKEAYYGKALAFHLSRKYSESNIVLRALLASYPSDFDGLLLYGDNFYLQNRYDSAIYWYQQGYDTGDHTSSLCYVMAYIHDVRGNQGRAIDLYREALGLDSTLTEIYVRLGELFPGPDGNFYRRKAAELKDQGYGN